MGCRAWPTPCTFWSVSGINVRRLVPARTNRLVSGDPDRRRAARYAGLLVDRVERRPDLGVVTRDREYIWVRVEPGPQRAERRAELTRIVEKRLRCVVGELGGDVRGVAQQQHPPAAGASDQQRDVAG